MGALEQWEKALSRLLCDASADYRPGLRLQYEQRA
jgi:hypothetical protein